MPKTKTKSFVLTLPLKTDSKTNAELNHRFNAGMRLYNNVLGEAQRRLDLSRSHSAWELAKAMPKTIAGKKKGDRIANPERYQLFQMIHEETGWTDYALQSYAQQAARDSIWIANKVDSNTVAKLANRAFKATERLIYGNASKLRFKVPSRFRSMEGKTNKQGIRFKDNCLVWGKLVIPAIFDLGNPYHAHGLSSNIKYVRVIRKEQKGYDKWFVQLICEGNPYQDPKNFVSAGIVGLDLNISNLAVVGDDQAELLPFAEGVKSISDEVAVNQRKMSRSDRVSNPTNYEPDFVGQKGQKTVKKKGKTKKKSKASTYNKSNNYRKMARKNRELNRIRTATARTQNQRLVNQVLRIGSNIKTEDVSVKGWQKRYGKAIGLKSPGFVQSELKRKAESAGGTFTKFSTRTTALSQTHLDLTRTKKSLSERVHKDNSGVVMQRDLFSAFLSRLVIDSLLPSDKMIINDDYQRLEPILVAGWQRYEEKQKNPKVVKSRWSEEIKVSVDSVALNLEKLAQLRVLGLGKL
jgi:putative transposase